MRLVVWLPVAICVATFFSTLSVVVVGFMYNNGRISDLRDDMNDRFSSLRDAMNQRFTSLEKRIDARLGRIEDILRIK